MIRANAFLCNVSKYATMFNARVCVPRWRWRYTEAKCGGGDEKSDALSKKCKTKRGICPKMKGKVGKSKEKKKN